MCAGTHYFWNILVSSTYIEKEERCEKMDMKNVIINFFPATLRKIWEKSECEWDKIEEIRIRVNKPIMIKERIKEYVLLKNGEIKEFSEGMDCNKYVIYTEKELEEILRHLCKDSVYAYEEERKQGFLVVQGGHRIGITGEVIHIEGKTYMAKYIRYMNIRIAHEIKGIANGVMKWLVSGEKIFNTLIVSAPGGGKTTLLRDITRILSDGTAECRGMGVGMIDERGELAGAYRGVASLDCGMRTDVITGGNKEQGARILIRTFAPRIIVMDEIGMRRDAESVLYAGVSGCNVIATAHGNSINDLKCKPEIQELLNKKVFQRIVFLNRGQHGMRSYEIWDGEGVQLCGENLLQEYLC